MKSLRPWLLALAAGAAVSCTWQQKATLGVRDRSSDTWLDYSIDPKEAADARELRALENRIGQGDLAKVQFDFDSEVIRPESFRSLEVIADWMLRHPNRKVRITAHTCAIGTAEYNLQLSERRAKSVKEFLVKQGVPPPSLRYKGMGLSQPLFDNGTEENREKNRRVEFRLVTRDWESVY